MVNSLSEQEQSSQLQTVENDNGLDGKLNFLRFLVHDAVDFVLNELFTAKPELASVKSLIGTTRESILNVCDVLENSTGQECEDDEINDTVEKIRFALDFLEYGEKTDMNGNLRDFVKNYEKYKTPGNINSMSIDLFGSEFNGFINAILKSKQNNDITPEETELWDRVRRNDIAAINQLVETHINLVHAAIRNRNNQFNSRIFDYEDLFHEGVIGLRMGITKFNPRLGYKLSTSVTWYIIAYIRKFILNNKYGFRYPAHFYTSMNKYRKFHNEFTALNGRNPTEDEIKKMFERDGQKIVSKKVLNLILQTELENNRIDLDCRSNHSDDRDKHEEIADSNNLNEEQRSYLRTIIIKELHEHCENYNFAKLGWQRFNRELAFHIITEYFFKDDATYSSISASWGNQACRPKPYSRERIRQFLLIILKSIQSNNTLIDLLERAVNN